MTTAIAIAFTLIALVFYRKLYLMRVKRSYKAGLFYWTFIFLLTMQLLTLWLLVVNLLNQTP